MNIAAIIKQAQKSAQIQKRLNTKETVPTTKVTGKISAKTAIVIRGRMRYNGRESAENQQSVQRAGEMYPTLPSCIIRERSKARSRIAAATRAQPSTIVLFHCDSGCSTRRQVNAKV